MLIWPDWARLVADGNAKAMGVPWSDDEWKILDVIADEEERKQVVEELREGTYKPKKTEKSEKSEKPETKTETPKKDSSKEPKKTEKSE